MASGLEIFLVIFIFLLVIVGISLGIYFVWRHDQKKRGPTSAPSNGGGTNGNGGTRGMTGVTGAAYSQNNMVWTAAPQPGATGFFFLDLSTPSSSVPCKDYLFNLQPDDTLVWQGDGKSVVAGTLVPRGSVLIGDAEVFQRSDNPTTIIWEYNETERTWCNKGSPKFCIQSDGQGSTMMNNVSGSETFKWDRLPTIPNSTVTCQAN